MSEKKPRLGKTCPCLTSCFSAKQPIGKTNYFIFSSQGDSGGPLYTSHEGKWYQVGLVSRGGVPSCSAPRQVVIYTRLSKFMDFIERFVNV